MPFLRFVRRSMNEEEILPDNFERERPNEIPMIRCQLVVCPFGGNARIGIEVFRFFQIDRRFIMIAEKDMRRHLTDQGDTLVRACAVSNNVAEADDLIDPFILEDC